MICLLRDPDVSEDEQETAAQDAEEEHPGLRVFVPVGLEEVGKGGHGEADDDRAVAQAQHPEEQLPGLHGRLETRLQLLQPSSETPDTSVEIVRTRTEDRPIGG